MLSIDGRAAKAAWTVFLIGLLLLVVYLIRKTLLIFTVALLFAYLLSPLVNLVERVASKRIPRIVSLALVYLLLLALLVSAGGIVGSRIVGEASALAGRLPVLLSGFENTLQLPLPAWLEPIRDNLLETLRRQLDEQSRNILPFLQTAGQQVLAALGNLTYVVIVLVLSFIFLKDAQPIRNSIVDQFIRGPKRALLEDILGDVHVLLAQFMRALFILCVATFTFYAIFFTVTGVPYALLLAGVAGLLEFIPFFGPLTAAVVILLVAATIGYPHLIWILVFLAIYRIFQDYVLQPYLMSAGVTLHPALVIFGVLAGEQIAGIPGMFLSIPVLAIFRVAYVRMQKARRQTEC